MFKINSYFFGIFFPVSRICQSKSSDGLYSVNPIVRKSSPERVCPSDSSIHCSLNYLDTRPPGFQFQLHSVSNNVKIN